MFVIPKLYQQYHHLLNSIIQDQVTPRATKSLTDVRRVMNEYWTVIKARNEVFCGNVSENPTLHKTQPVHETSGDEERVVNLLDSIGKNIDSVAGLLISGDTWIDVHGHSAKWGSKMIFSKTRLELESILKLVHSICRWAVNESRYGDWKAYLVASILLSWKEEGDSMEKKKLLQEALIRFLDGETSPKNMDMLNGSQVDEEGNWSFITIECVDLILYRQLYQKDE